MRFRLWSASARHIPVFAGIECDNHPKSASADSPRASQDAPCRWLHGSATAQAFRSAPPRQNIRVRQLRHGTAGTSLCACMVSHEGHHRGQILIPEQRVDYRLPPKLLPAFCAGKNVGSIAASTHVENRISSSVTALVGLDARFRREFELPFQMDFAEPVSRPAGPRLSVRIAASRKTIPLAKRLGV